MENDYIIPNNRKSDIKINFPWKNIFYRKWFFRKTIFLSTKHYLNLKTTDYLLLHRNGVAEV